MKKILLLLFMGISLNALACSLKGVTLSGISGQCKGEKDTLIVNGPNGTTYLWSNGSTKTTLITGVINDDTTISVTATNGGCDTTIQFPITIWELTVAVPPASICLGQCVKLKATPSGGGPYSFIWSNGATTDTSTFCPYADSAFRVTVSNVYGCIINKIDSVSVLNCTGINEIQYSEKSTVYPNPSNGAFTLSLSNITEKCKIEIYNVLGEKIYNATLAPQTSKRALSEINISSQPSGVYFYSVISESGELVGEGKIIIEK